MGTSRADDGMDKDKTLRAPHSDGSGHDISGDVVCVGEHVPPPFALSTAQSSCLSRVLVRSYNVKGGKGGMRGRLGDAERETWSWLKGGSRELGVLSK